MTQPTEKQIEEFEYPKTLPAIVGFGLAKFGILFIVFFMVFVQFYSAQRQTERIIEVLASNAAILERMSQQLETMDKESDESMRDMDAVISTILTQVNKIK